jgi:hypothetical protein
MVLAVHPKITGMKYKLRLGYNIRQFDTHIKNKHVGYYPVFTLNTTLARPDTHYRDIFTN